MANKYKEVHLKTIKKYGIEDMIEKFVTELFEVAVKMASSINHMDSLTEEIADCFNMVDKLEVAGYRFDFASTVHLHETIKVMMRYIAKPGYKDIKDIHCSPKVMLSNIMFDYGIKMAEVEFFMEKKMERTAIRLRSEK